MPNTFFGTLQRTTGNVKALETGAHRGVRMGFVSFYTRRDVVYVYLETVDPLRSASALKEAWGEPSFFMDTTRWTYEDFTRNAGDECRTVAF
jgi:hypothetical protein